MKNIQQNIQQSFWKGRAAKRVAYWYQAVTCIKDLAIVSNNKGEIQKKIGLLGYAGDEGVRRNHGRTGASEGPDTIRKMMATMAYHLTDGHAVYDYGNITTQNQGMEASHKYLSDTISRLLSRQHFPVIMGGGHDLAFAHVHGIMNYLKSKNKSMGIINLDAHFDLRDLVEGKGHSGSPFFQLAQHFGKEFRYCCLGIQQASNPPELFETAQYYGVEWMEMEEFNLSNWKSIQAKISHFIGRVDYVYLSIDLDGFSSAFAPGVSAPSPLGFSPDFAFRIFDLLAHSQKLISMDVVELNPVFDQDNSTAKLAARCIEYILRKMNQYSAYPLGSGRNMHLP